MCPHSGCLCIWASVAGVDTKVGVEGVRDRLDIDRVSHDGQTGRWREVANATCRENVRGWGCLEATVIFVVPRLARREDPTGPTNGWFFL